MAAPVPTQAPTTTATPVVNFITGNKNKLSEVKAILEPTIQVNSQALDLIEVQGTLEEVTLAKCRAAAEQVRIVSLYISVSYAYNNTTQNPCPSSL